jgi:hypothetical protein
MVMTDRGAEWEEIYESVLYKKVQVPKYNVVEKKIIYITHEFYGMSMEISLNITTYAPTFETTKD